MELNLLVCATDEHVNSDFQGHLFVRIDQLLFGKFENRLQQVNQS